VFALIIDFISYFYIIRYKIFVTKPVYFAQTYFPKIVTALLLSYAAYSVANPTHELSHFYRRHGPRFIGALGAVAHTRGSFRSN
jgi:hypothetical protein